jgi:hypothetical protein
VEGSGPDFHVVGLLNQAALIGPIRAEVKNNILKIHLDASSVVVLVLSSVPVAWSIGARHA